MQLSTILSKASVFGGTTNSPTQKCPYLFDSLAIEIWKNWACDMIYSEVRSRAPTYLLTIVTKILCVSCHFFRCIFSTSFSAPKTTLSYISHRLYPSPLSLNRTSVLATPVARRAVEKCLRCCRSVFCGRRWIKLPWHSPWGSEGKAVGMSHSVQNRVQKSRVLWDIYWEDGQDFGSHVSSHQILENRVKFPACSMWVFVFHLDNQLEYMLVRAKHCWVIYISLF